MPRVDYIKIEYTMHQIEASQLSQFIKRTENLKIDQLMRAEVVFYHEDPFFKLSCSEGKFNQAHLFLQIFDEVDLETQVWGMVHVLRERQG
jgi:hypothetical protein